MGDSVNKSVPMRKYHRFCISPQSYRLPAHQLIDVKDQEKKLFCTDGEESAASAYLQIIHRSEIICRRLFLGGR
jgi:hypothetical protein